MFNLLINNSEILVGKEEEDYLRVKTRVLVGVGLFPRVTLMETTLFVTFTDMNLISSPEIWNT
ncbi:MAG: hypothetical protein WCF23_09895 [Candidatus Nitrosopolaris sp.]